MAQDNNKRYYIIVAALGVILCFYTFKLFSLQVLNKSYKRQANENATTRCLSITMLPTI